MEPSFINDNVVLRSLVTRKVRNEKIKKRIETTFVASTRLFIMRSIDYYFLRHVKSKYVASNVAAPAMIGAFLSLLSDVYSLSLMIKLIFCGLSAKRRMK